MRRLHLIALAAAALLGAAPVASAAGTTAQDPDSLSVRVRVADLDLQSRDGARVALQRIHHAAETVCGGEPDGRELARHAMFESCVRSAVDRTVLQSHSPALAGLNGTPLIAGALAAAN
jgi:UrcA family protein